MSTYECNECGIQILVREVRDIPPFGLGAELVGLAGERVGSVEGSEDDGDLAATCVACEELDAAGKEE